MHIQPSRTRAICGGSSIGYIGLAVSKDYGIGRYGRGEMPRPPSHAFAAWLRGYLALHGITTKALAQKIDVKYATMYSWTSGRRGPQAHHLALIMVHLSQLAKRPREEVARELLESFVPKAGGISS